MASVVPFVRRSFEAWQRHDVLQPAKTTLKYADMHEKYGGLVNVLPAAIRNEHETTYGVKIMGAMPSNTESGIPRATGIITLFDGDTKTPVVILDAQVISAMRTGAVSAIAAEKLCRKNSATLGLIGAGVNMRTQLLGLLSVLPHITTVNIFSRGQSKHDFVQTMSIQFPTITFTAHDSARDAVVDADVVVTCVANSDSPVVAAADLQSPGLTVFNIGCLENEPILLRSMDLIVADYWEHSKHRGIQTHAIAYQQGIISDSDVINLEDILSGAQAGRTNDQQRIFFCPTGLGMEDIAVAKAFFELAIAKQVGTSYQLWDKEAWI